MLPDVAGDLRLILSGGFGSNVTLSNGAVIRANPSVATVEDTLGGQGIIAGFTQVLTLATADAPGLAARQTLTWDGVLYAVNHIAYKGQGNLVRVFLGTP